MDMYKTENHAERLNLDLPSIYQNAENRLYVQTNKKKCYFGQYRQKQAKKHTFIEHIIPNNARNKIASSKKA